MENASLKNSTTLLQTYNRSYVSGPLVDEAKAFLLARDVVWAIVLGDLMCQAQSLNCQNFAG